MITIVIPCFNEATRLQPEVFTTFLEGNGDISFLFVDDGSSDSTLDVVIDLEKKSGGNVSHLSLNTNRGKAEAVRQGMLHALKSSNKYIGYWDADLSTPLTEIQNLTQILETQRCIKIVSGARIQRMGTDITRRWYRHYPGRLIATCISVMLNIPVYDTQCGAKLLDREIVRNLFKEPFLSPWLFDVEMIARLMSVVGREQIQDVLYEFPLNSWQDVGESKISLLYLPRIPIELLRIYYHYRSELR